ncbi:MAG: hypothetical protein PHX08_07815 [Lachnospiraceae bacterium]|nr:hypothetical protein [Lachnospiraceae bacterium]
MRAEFLFNKETQKKETYFTEAALWVDSMRNGTILSDGRCLVSELSEDEKQEFMNYLMGLLMPEIDTVTRFKKNRTSLNYHKTEELKAILTMKVYEDFHKFNNVNYLKNKQKRYTISTFVDHKAREAMRELLIQERNLHVNAIRNLRIIINTVVAIAEEQEICPDAVTPEMVYDRLNEKSISYKMVLSLMEIYHGVPSIDEMEDSDERLQDNTMNVEVRVNLDMDKKTNDILDSVFYDFSKMELFIFMKEFGFLGNKARSMTAKELSYKDYFVAMAREDKDGGKNIEFGNVQIKRPGRNSGCEEEIFVESVYYVKEKFYSNKVAKIKKKLAGLNGKLSVLDVQGCLEEYCIRLWKEKY